MFGSGSDTQPDSKIARDRGSGSGGWEVGGGYLER